jgi:rhodanese-related sulfurtransferase
MVQPISRDDLCALLESGTVTLVDALPEPHYAAEHLPGAAEATR